MMNITPDSIFQVATGFMASKHLFVANEIGLFEHLAEGPFSQNQPGTSLSGDKRHTAKEPDKIESFIMFHHPPLIKAHLLKYKTSSEDYLRESGIPYTILAPNGYMELWISMVVGIPTLMGQSVTIVGGGRRDEIHTRKRGFPMSQEQVQDVQTHSSPKVVFERTIQALNRHDLDTMVACFAPDYRSEQPFHPELNFTGPAAD